MQIPERRKLERFEMTIPARVRFKEPGREKMEVTLITRNICSGGAFFKTSKPLPVGTKVDIDLTLPLNKLKRIKDVRNQVSISLTGKVLHTETTGMGVGFDEEYQIFS
ncbi:MAG: PilZ domain-containing protein [Deltaproteobacteria bacterium]|nr:PilZ domain-containing protein [Deltaproteobacteria bacterium]MBW1962412.1 PilZ domain-containing protein [Deltaproteobacteria bacterium]MBW1994286.1 PilZ domain-containing protein [Deltaproteobacteria bacterium]MBW2151401.1 PilZ domain-containing protein [Deltaproteobacteria bacterium]